MPVPRSSSTQQQQHSAFNSSSSIQHSTAAFGIQQQQHSAFLVALCSSSSMQQVMEWLCKCHPSKERYIAGSAQFEDTVLQHMAQDILVVPTAAAHNLHGCRQSTINSPAALSQPRLDRAHRAQLGSVHARSAPLEALVGAAAPVRCTAGSEAQAHALQQSTK